MKTKILITGSENVIDANLVIKAFDHLVSDVRESDNEMIIYSSGMMGVQSLIEKYCISSGINLMKFSMFNREEPLPIERVLVKGKPRIKGNIQYVADECDYHLYLNSNNDNLNNSPFSALHYSLGTLLRDINVNHYIRYKKIEPKKAYKTAQTKSVEASGTVPWDDYVKYMNDVPRKDYIMPKGRPSRVRPHPAEPVESATGIEIIDQADLVPPTYYHKEVSNEDLDRAVMDVIRNNYEKRKTDSLISPVSYADHMEMISRETEREVKNTEEDPFNF